MFFQNLLTVCVSVFNPLILKGFLAVFEKWKFLKNNYHVLVIDIILHYICFVD